MAEPSQASICNVKDTCGFVSKLTFTFLSSCKDFQYTDSKSEHEEHTQELQSWDLEDDDTYVFDAEIFENDDPYRDIEARTIMSKTPSPNPSEKFSRESPKHAKARGAANQAIRKEDGNPDTLISIFQDEDLPDLERDCSDSKDIIQRLLAQIREEKVLFESLKGGKDAIIEEIKIEIEIDQSEEPVNAAPLDLESDNEGSVDSALNTSDIDNWWWVPDENVDMEMTGGFSVSMTSTLCCTDYPSVEMRKLPYSNLVCRTCSVHGYDPTRCEYETKYRTYCSDTMCGIFTPTKCKGEVRCSREACVE